MKTRLSILAVAAGLVLLGFSCKDKENGVPFSEKSIEDNKAVVENSAIELAQTMDAMKDVQTVDAAVSFGNLLGTATPFGEAKSSKVPLMVNAIAGLSQGRNSVHDLMNAMRAPAELEGDPESLKEVWDSLVGTYSWNGSTESWDKTSSTDKIQFRFPSTDGGLTNDATFTIFNYAGVMVANPIDEDYSGDLPVSLNMDLKVGSTTLMTYTFAAAYNDEGVPSSVASNLTIEKFSFSIDLTNTKTEVSSNFTFKHENTVVMSVGGGINGDFTQENIDANTETITDTWTWTDWVYNPITDTYDPVERTETDEYTEVKTQEIIHAAHAKFQVFNIALVGKVNVRNLVNEIDALYPDNYWEDPNYDEQAARQKEAGLMNKYLSIYAMNVKANEKIAQAEAYVMSDEYYPGEFEYNVDMRLKFGDGSLVDMETYFDQGFEDFVNEINTMLAELNTDYGWELEPIDY